MHHLASTIFIKSKMFFKMLNGIYFIDAVHIILDGDYFLTSFRLILLN